MKTTGVALVATVVVNHLEHLEACNVRNGALGRGTLPPSVATAPGDPQKRAMLVTGWFAFSSSIKGNVSTGSRE